MTSKLQNKSAAPLGIVLIAVWALLQIPRLGAWPIIQSVMADDDSSAWLYPAYIDVFIGITAVFVAFAVWRLRGVWVWMTALIWFTISIYDHLDATLAALNAPIPESFLGGEKSLVLISLFVGVVLDVAAITALTRQSLRDHYLGTEPASEPIPPRPRATINFFIVWAVLQIPRYVAIPLVISTLEGDDPIEWLNPAVGDIIVATSAFYMIYIVMRKTGLWVWAVSLIWLVLSVFDHLSTITAGLIIGTTPEQFEGFGGGRGGAAVFPTLQGVIDILVFLLMAREGVRLYFTYSRPTR